MNYIFALTLDAMAVSPRPNQAINRDQCPCFTLSLRTRLLYGRLGHKEKSRISIDAFERLEKEAAELEARRRESKRLTS